MSPNRVVRISTLTPAMLEDKKPKKVSKKNEKKDDEPQDEDLTNVSKKRLLEVMEERGIECPEGATKEEMLALINGEVEDEEVEEKTV